MSPVTKEKIVEIINVKFARELTAAALSMNVLTGISIQLSKGVLVAFLGLLFEDGKIIIKEVN